MTDKKESKWDNSEFVKLAKQFGEDIAEISERVENELKETLLNSKEVDLFSHECKKKVNENKVLTNSKHFISNDTSPITAAGLDTIKNVMQKTGNAMHKTGEIVNKAANTLPGKLAKDLLTHGTGLADPIGVIKDHLRSGNPKRIKKFDKEEYKSFTDILHKNAKIFIDFCDKSEFFKSEYTVIKQMGDSDISVGKELFENAKQFLIELDKEKDGNNGNIKQTNNGKFNAAYAAELKNIFNIINILIDITKDDKVSKQIIELDKVLDKNSNYATDLFDFIKRNIVTSVNALARNNNFSKYSKQIQTVLCTEICADILEKQNFNTKLISAIDFVFLDILYLIKK